MQKDLVVYGKCCTFAAAKRINIQDEDKKEPIRDAAHDYIKPADGQSG
jgi:hypothetical protein